MRERNKEGSIAKRDGLQSIHRVHRSKPGNPQNSQGLGTAQARREPTKTKANKTVGNNKLYRISLNANDLGLCFIRYKVAELTKMQM